MNSLHFITCATHWQLYFFRFYCFVLLFAVFLRSAAATDCVVCERTSNESCTMYPNAYCRIAATIYLSVQNKLDVHLLKSIIYMRTTPECTHTHSATSFTSTSSPFSTRHELCSIFIHNNENVSRSSYRMEWVCRLHQQITGNNNEIKQTTHTYTHTLPPIRHTSSILLCIYH